MLARTIRQSNGSNEGEIRAKGTSPSCPAIDQLTHPRSGTCDIGAVQHIGGLAGNVLTAFVTAINSGPTTATQVGIGLAPGVPALLSFQTTAPGTNGLIGTANTRWTSPPARIRSS